MIEAQKSMIIAAISRRSTLLSGGYGFLIKKCHGLEFVRLLLKNREEQILVSKYTVLASLALYYDVRLDTRKKMKLLARNLNKDTDGMRYLRLLLKH